MGRHSGATTCRVSILRHDAAAVIQIDDDGQGFEANSAPRGMGLGNLVERAEAIGGQLEIESKPGSGTTITVTVPL